MEFDPCQLKYLLDHFTDQLVLTPQIGRHQDNDLNENDCAEDAEGNPPGNRRLQAHEP
jgi:hypothetical protein